MVRDRLEREYRIGDLIDQIQRYMSGGRMDVAVPLQREAVMLARELLEEQPDEPRYVQGLASILYGMGSTLTATDEPDEAVELLDECERLYERLPGTEAYRADVCARRGMAESARGFGPSAVLELDDAVDRYVRLESRDDLDLARVLALGATVWHRHADPDLAVTAADAAIRIYLNAGGAETPYFIFAVEVASQIHGAFGRLDLALAADELALQALSGTTPDAVRLAQARVRQQEHLSGSLAAQRDRSMTFAEALDLAAPVDESLRDLLIDPLGTGRIPLPSGRCSGDARLAVVNGLALSEHALRLLESSPEAGRRLGLETHFLFAIGARGNEPNLRFNFGPFGRMWAAVVLATARSFESAGDAETCQDLKRWLGGIVQQLIPFAAIDRNTADMVAECEAYVRQA
ncbi:hypothetical protein [Allorhizocola rhizosphaerae]|uniref:hypothetical protein n=1 Tax=Allorhizocola rhizosphaerae TaxID=1872709 RepID=UPI000E3C84EA|nr:hypothetical protein [Allorhizocola rhizosphaerae]